MVRFKPDIGFWQWCWPLTFILVLVCIQLPGQRLIYDHHGIRSGLSNRLVRDIELDVEGLVWVATPNGLNRFDGYDFIPFSPSKGFASEARLSQSYVQDITVAPDDQLFLFYEDLYSSFDIFNPITFAVNRIEVALKVDGQPRRFYVNRNHEVFVISKGDDFTSVSVYDYNTDNFTEICRLQEQWERQYPIVDLLVDHQGRIILYDQEHGLRTCSNLSNSVNYLPAVWSETKEPPAHLNISHQDRKDRIWLSFQGNLGYQLDIQEDSLSLFNQLSKEKMFAYAWEDDNANLIFSEASTIGNFAESEHLWCWTADQRLVNFDHLLQVGQYIVNIRGKDFFRTLFIGTDTGLKVTQNTNKRIDRYLATGVEEGQRGISMRGGTSDGSNRVFFARGGTALVYIGH